MGLGCESLNPDEEEDDDGYAAATGKRSEGAAAQGMEGKDALRDVILHGLPLLVETTAFAHKPISQNLNTNSFSMYSSGLPQVTSPVFHTPVRYMDKERDRDYRERKTHT